MRSLILVALLLTSCALKRDVEVKEVPVDYGEYYSYDVPFAPSPEWDQTKQRQITCKKSKQLDDDAISKLRIVAPDGTIIEIIVRKEK